MNRADLIPTKIFTAAQIVQRVVQWRILGKKIVFTNGVFDILHEGHIFSLSQAAKEADFLIVGLNADASVKRLKGESRPVNKQDSRALILASLIMVDAVVIFEEDTPLELIKSIMPEVLVIPYSPRQHRSVWDSGRSFRSIRFCRSLQLWSMM